MSLKEHAALPASVIGESRASHRLDAIGAKNVSPTRIQFQYRSSNGVPNEQLQPTPYCSGGAQRARREHCAPDGRRLAVSRRG